MGQSTSKRRQAYHQWDICTPNDRVYNNHLFTAEARPARKRDPRKQVVNPPLQRTRLTKAAPNRGTASTSIKRETPNERNRLRKRAPEQAQAKPRAGARSYWSPIQSMSPTEGGRQRTWRASRTFLRGLNYGQDPLFVRIFQRRKGRTGRAGDHYMPTAESGSSYHHSVDRTSTSASSWSSHGRGATDAIYTRPLDGGQRPASTTALESASSAPHRPGPRARVLKAGRGWTVGFDQPLEHAMSSSTLRDEAAKLAHRRFPTEREAREARDVFESELTSRRAAQQARSASSRVPAGRSSASSPGDHRRVTVPSERNGIMAPSSRLQ